MTAYQVGFYEMAKSEAAALPSSLPLLLLEELNE